MLKECLFKNNGLLESEYKPSKLLSISLIWSDHLP